MKLIFSKLYTSINLKYTGFWLQFFVIRGANKKIERVIL